MAVVGHRLTLPLATVIRTLTRQPLSDFLDSPASFTTASADSVTYLLRVAADAAVEACSTTSRGPIRSWLAGALAALSTDIALIAARAFAHHFAAAPVYDERFTADNPVAFGPPRLAPSRAVHPSRAAPLTRPAKQALHADPSRAHELVEFLAMSALYQGGMTPLAAFAPCAVDGVRASVRAAPSPCDLRCDA